jgi:hypothetical protein
MASLARQESLDFSITKLLSTSFFMLPLKAVFVKTFSHSLRKLYDLENPVSTPLA